MSRFVWIVACSVSSILIFRATIWGWTVMDLFASFGLPVPTNPQAWGLSVLASFIRPVPESP